MVEYLWVHQVPQLSRLRLLGVVSAEEPAKQSQVLHVVTAISVGELLVEVSDRLRRVGLRFHEVEVKSKDRCNGSHMLISHVKSVAEALDSSLEVAVVHAMQFDLALSAETKVFFLGSTVDYGHPITDRTATSHFTCINLNLCSKIDIINEDQFIC